MARNARKQLFRANHNTAATMRAMKRKFAVRCILEFHAKVEADRIDVADVERYSITIKLEMAVRIATAEAAASMI